MSDLKKILIITYYWPPSGGGGVQRWMYFARYLKSFGFDPTVITVHPDKASYPLLDPTQLEGVKDIRTLYTDTREPLKLYAKLKGSKSNNAIPYGNLGEKGSGIIGKLMAFIRVNFFIPDARKGWVPFALKAAQKELEQIQYHWLVTTGPPHSTHLAGLKLARKYPVRWLADFRDPWTEIYFLQTGLRMDFARKKDAALEQDVLDNADLVSTVGPGMASLLGSKMKNPGKLQILYNGYDHELFDEIKGNRLKNNRFTISHIGLLGESQRFESLLAAIHHSGIDRNTLQIELAGTVDAKHRKVIREEFPGLLVNEHGFVNRKTALTLMKTSDLLLLCPPMSGNTELIVSTKTMEYLASGTPVLGIGDPRSDAAALVRQQSFSGFFDPSDTEGIAQFLNKTYMNWYTDTETENTFRAERYSRFSVARELAAVLNEFNQTHRP